MCVHNSIGIVNMGQQTESHGKEQSSAHPKKRRFGWEPRHGIVLICFLATFCAYVERVGFSIAFTAIAKSGGLDEGVKGTILSAFYWGYGVSQVTSLYTE